MSIRIASLATLALLGCDPGGGADAGRSDAPLPSEDTSFVGDVSVPDGGAPEADGGEDAGTDGGVREGSAADWIREHFAAIEGTTDLTGDFDSRTRVETPALVDGATACCAKYAFDVREEAAPDLREVGLVDVMISDLESTDAFGGGIQVSGAAGATLFLANVVIEPNWPEWVSYAETNYDGMVLDDAAAIYAEDLTVRNWNADGAIDNKAPISQFVRLTIEGRGNRGIRYWGAGPHYLVASSLTNEGGLGEGSLMWFSDCDTVEVRIYASTFDGESTVPADAISCDNGSDPELVYLTTDPRTTGEMHEMFGP